MPVESSCIAAFGSCMKKHNITLKEKEPEKQVRRRKRKRKRKITPLPPNKKKKQYPEQQHCPLSLFPIPATD